LINKMLEAKGSEWKKNINLAYHLKQYNKTFRSTEIFFKWLEQKKLLNINAKKTYPNIIEYGCGMGGNLAYLNKQYPFNNLYGIDFSKTLIDTGNKIIKKNQLNISLSKHNFYKPFVKKNVFFEGVLSIQTLSWLPNYIDPLNSIIKTRPNWIAGSSLFYDGPIESFIIMKESYSKNKKKYEKTHNYNVYSIDKFKNFLKIRGYNKISFKKFNIDIYLSRTKSKGSGTFTIKNKKEERMQFSGPIYLPWYFFIAEKK